MKLTTLYIIRNHDIQCSHTLYGHTARVWNAVWLSSSCVLSISEDATCRVWEKHKGCLQIITGHKVRNYDYRKCIQL